VFLGLAEPARFFVGFIVLKAVGLRIEGWDWVWGLAGTTGAGGCIKKLFMLLLFMMLVTRGYWG